MATATPKVKMYHQLNAVYDKLQRKKNVWQSIIKAIENAIARLRKNAKSSGDKLILSSFCAKIDTAKKEYVQFRDQLHEIKKRMERHRAEYYNIKKELNYLNNEAQLAIEQLRSIAKDIVDINKNTPPSSPLSPSNANKTQRNTTKTQRKVRMQTPPTPPKTLTDHKHLSSTSSTSFTMTRQRNEIAQIRERIKDLRNVLPEVDDNDNGNDRDRHSGAGDRGRAEEEESKCETFESLEFKSKRTKNSKKHVHSQRSPPIKSSKYKNYNAANTEFDDVHNVHIEDVERERALYLNKFDEMDKVFGQKRMRSTFNKLDEQMQLNQNSSKVIADELRDLRSALGEYQDLVQSASELCTNSVHMITEKNQSLTSIASAKKAIERKLGHSKREIEQLKDDNAHLNSALEQKTKLSERLETEIEELKETLHDIQSGFQVEIDSLKKDLEDAYGTPEQRAQVSLAYLLKQLEIEDEHVRSKITRIMEDYRHKRKEMFLDAKHDV